jgi:hypothetical protein
VRLPLVEPTQATREEIIAALAAVDDGYSSYLIDGAGWLAARVHAAAE